MTVVTQQLEQNASQRNTNKGIRKGAFGNFSGYKNPIGIYSGKNIYEWFVPTPTSNRKGVILIWKR